VRLHRWRDRPNFGDELNDVLWPEHFGPFLHEDDDVIFAAIGTVLGPALGEDGEIIVFGSGCGYDPLPARGARWSFYFVRGPLSARLLGLDAQLAITDPAILMAEKRPKVDADRVISFMPHWETALSPLWREACALADIQYIDPLAPVPEICVQLARSSTVIAEAMHGAIVADAFRVPWIPAYSSGRFNLFKWQDWGLSLGLSPAIHPLPQIGIADLLRTILVDPDENLRFIAEAGSTIHAHAERPLRFERLNRLYARSFAKPTRSWLEYKLLERLGPDLDRIIGRLHGRAWQSRIERAAAALRAIAMQRTYLSTDDACATALERVHEKIRELQRDLGGAAWDTQAYAARL
jgi:hypothetical protein